MACEGDKIAGQNYDADCYRNEACFGCDKCNILCEGCENCPKSFDEHEIRQVEAGDYIVVHKKPIIMTSWKKTWNPAMDNAIGRTAYIIEGNPVDGFKLKFDTTNTEILDHFAYPGECMRLAGGKHGTALPDDKSLDKMIKTVKEKDENSNV